MQNAMTGSDTSLMGGAAAAITLLVLNYVVAEASRGRIGDSESWCRDHPRCSSMKGSW